MAERTHIPNSPDCRQWEMLLADALDGLLRPEDEALFTAHMAVCPACAALFEESRRGREWLEFLSPEPEVPAGLLDKILAQTGPGQMEGYGLVPRRQSTAHASITAGLAASRLHGRGFAAFAEPRLLMTAAMAFFSIALTLNLTGVRLRAVRLAICTMRAPIRRSAPSWSGALTMASTPIIRYYDHSRLVYEVESRVRELRRATENDRTESAEDPARLHRASQNRIPAAQRRSPRRKLSAAVRQPAGNRTIPMTIWKLPSRFITGTDSRIPAAPQHSGGSELEVRERSTVWTA